jgi:hypothetical protein
MTPFLKIFNNNNKKTTALTVQTLSDLPFQLKYKHFIGETTTAKGEIRGPRLMAIEEALKVLNAEFQTAGTEVRIKLLTTVLSRCSKWLKAKNEKEDKQGQPKHLEGRLKRVAARRSTVLSLANEALECLAGLHAHKAALVYQRNKFAVLGDPKSVSTISLHGGYKLERESYERDKSKRFYPPAAGRVREVHALFGPNVGDNNNNNALAQVGDVQSLEEDFRILGCDVNIIKSALTKTFDNLSVVEYQTLSKYCELVGKKRLYVKYIKCRDRLKYMVFVGKDGLLYCYDEHADKEVPLDIGRRSLFVIDRYKTIYYSEEDGYHVLNGQDATHHSSLVSGNDVMFAGSWQVEKGELVYLCNDSGHYRPKRLDTHNAVKTLHELGTDLQNCDLDIIQNVEGEQMRERFVRRGSQRTEYGVADFAKNSKYFGQLEKSNVGKM